MGLSSYLAATDLRCEYLENPLGIDVLRPRLSWRLISEERGVVQSAYQIRVEGEGGELWDTGKVLSDQSVHVAYGGPQLRSGQHCVWRVRAWDGDDEASEWSEKAWWEMGLLNTSDWRARWIEPDWDEDPEAFKPCPFLRRSFSVKAGVKSARLYITCHGLYEPWLSGRRVGDQVFTPGYTSYHKRLQYQAYDVTDLLVEGENALGVVLGDGWYRGKICALSVRNFYGDRLALLAQLHIRFEDGQEELVVSDGNWRATTGPILKSDMKDGETYDARLEMPGWNTPGFDDGAWKGVRVLDQSMENLVASTGPPIRRREEFTPIDIIRTPAGETVVDMGQNLAGIVRLKVRGPAGTTVTMKHGESLDKDGNFTMNHLQIPRPGFDKLLQEVTFTLKGCGEEIYEPHFTVQGFRYVKVEGFPGEARPDNFTGVAIYSDMPLTGTFRCSSPMINQLHHNIEWSQKGNFLDIPTDCPTRERAGWTGDAQVFVRTGSTIMDTAAFFTKWLKDLAADQEPDGLVHNLAPCVVMAEVLEGSAGWGDAAVIIPWELYLVFGDKRILEQQYESMKAWVEYERSLARKSHWIRKINPRYWFSKAKREHQRYIWDTKWHWGEWLEPGEGSGFRIILGAMRRRVFSEPLVATTYFAHSTRLLAKIALILGREQDARDYSELSRRIKAAYITEFVGADGRIKPDKQASYARILEFDLLPEELRPAIVKRLVELIRKNDTHIGTGFLSTPFICHVLTRNGYLDVAYELLNQHTRPSWLYPVKMGATTIWEMWDGIKEDGTPQGSHNHYSYGAIGGWLYRVVAGIELDPDAPGYKHFFIAPRPGGGLTQAEGTYHSIYGLIRSGWRIEEGQMTMEIKVPVNTTATVRLPDARLEDLRENGVLLQNVPEVFRYTQECSAVVLEVGSGEYELSYRLDPNAA